MFSMPEVAAREFDKPIVADTSRYVQGRADTLADRRLGRGLVAEGRGDLRLGRVDGLADRRIFSQSTFQTLGPGRGQHLVLEKAQHRPGLRGRPPSLFLLVGCAVERQFGFGLGASSSDSQHAADEHAHDQQPGKRPGDCQRCAMLARDRHEIILK
jgi:hypothetical protein